VPEYIVKFLNFFPDAALFLFRLGRSEKTPPQLVAKLFTRHALPSPHRVGPAVFPDKLKFVFGFRLSRLAIRLPPFATRDSTFF